MLSVLRNFLSPSFSGEARSFTDEDRSVTDSYESMPSETARPAESTSGSCCYSIDDLREIGQSPLAHSQLPYEADQFLRLHYSHKDQERTTPLAIAQNTQRHEQPQQEFDVSGMRYSRFRSNLTTTSPEPLTLPKIVPVASPSILASRLLIDEIAGECLRDDNIEAAPVDESTTGPRMSYVELIEGLEAQYDEIVSPPPLRPSRGGSYAALPDRAFKAAAGEELVALKEAIAADKAAAADKTPAPEVSRKAERARVRVDLMRLAPLDRVVAIRHLRTLREAVAEFWLQNSASCEQYLERLGGLKKLKYLKPNKNAVQLRLVLNTRSTRYSTCLGAVRRWLQGEVVPAEELASACARFLLSAYYNPHFLLDVTSLLLAAPQCSANHKCEWYIRALKHIARIKARNTAEESVVKLILDKH